MIRLVLRTSAREGAGRRVASVMLPVGVCVFAGRRR